MKESTIDEKRELAEKAQTSLSLLYQLSYDPPNNRNASSGLAGRIEKAAAMIGKRKRHAPLPELRRGDLAEDCANCKLYKECGE
jgi:hypothetical protein